MIILDQNTVEGDFDLISEIHGELIKDLMLEIVDEISPLGLTVMQSSLISVDVIVKKHKDAIKPHLEKYDYKIGDKKYKLENITFY